MAFDFDGMKKKVKEAVAPVCPVVNQITEKSSDLFNKGKIQTEILKLQYQISQDEKALNQLYAEAGKLAYQNHVEGNAAEAVAEQFLLIQAAEEALAAAKDQIVDCRAKIEEINEAAAARAAEGYACKDCDCDCCAAEAPAEDACDCCAAEVPAEGACDCCAAEVPAEEAAPAEVAPAAVEESAPAEEAPAPAEEAAAAEEEKAPKKRGARKN